MKENCLMTCQLCVSDRDVTTEEGTRDVAGVKPTPAATNSTTAAVSTTTTTMTALAQSTQVANVSGGETTVTMVTTAKPEQCVNKVK